MITFVTAQELLYTDKIN